MESLVATFTLTFMASATPNDETTPMFVFDPAMPAMSGGRILNRRRQRKDTVAGMAHSYTGKNGVFHAKGHPDFCVLSISYPNTKGLIYFEKQT